MATPTGTLITTSVRATIIDPVLLPRIDLAIQFKLSKELSRQIWNNCLAAFGSQTRIPEEYLDEFSEGLRYPLDGHVIMNIIQSASRIAQTEHRDINIMDIKPYVKAYAEFSHYLPENYGGQNSQLMVEKKSMGSY